MMDIPTGYVKVEAWRLCFTPAQCRLLEQLKSNEYTPMKIIRENTGMKYHNIYSLIETLRKNGAIVVKSCDGTISIKRSF